MKRFKWFLICLVIAAAAGCAPAVEVRNTTSFPVRVFVTSSGGRSVVSPSPGESSAVEIGFGSYAAVAIADAEWVAYARATRQYLNDQLANASQLSVPQLLDVINRLKQVAAQMAAFEQAAGKGSACSGGVGDEASGVVTVSTGAGGALTLTCK